MDEESKYCNEIINYIIDSMINIFVDKKRKISFDCEEIYEIPINFFLFNDDNRFYYKLSTLYEKILQIHSKIDNFLNKIESYINQRNFIIFLYFFKNIISQYKDAYKNPIIKLNIYLIIIYFAENKGEKIINSIEYFYICKKELEKIYDKKCDINKTDLDNKWMNDFNYTIEFFKQCKFDNVLNVFQYIKKNCVEKNNYEYYDEVIETLKKLKENKNNFEFGNNILKNKDNEKYFKIYLKNIVKENGYDENNKEHKLKIEELSKNKFFLKIFFKLI